MGAPETGSGGSGGGGGWITVQPGLPDVFVDVIETIQSLLNALLAILNIILAVLQIVKAFIAGLLNPLQAIIDAIIEEIEGLLNDIRQIGIYISGDLDLDPPEFGTILGGFSAYERRMIARLVNRTDPTRPDFSSRSAVIAIFLYASADTSSIGNLIAVIQRVMAFFGRKIDVSVTSVATALEVSYGTEGASLSSFGSITASLKSGDVPNQANIRWLMAPSGQQTRFLAPAPKGFLIEVSTVPDGLLLAWDTFVKNSPVGAEINTRVQGLIRDPRNGLPFRLYGGVDMINVTDLEDGTFSPDGDGTDRETRLYAYRSSADNVPIPLNLLKEGSGSDAKYLLQRTFFVKGGFLSSASPGQGFSATLQHEDMPWKADFENNGGTITATRVGEAPADTVYIRVSEITDTMVTLLENTGTTASGPLAAPVNFWITTSARVNAQASEGSVQLDIPFADRSGGDKGEPSAPLTITFPGTSTRDYLDALTAALVVLILGRCDLPVADEGDDFAVGKAAAPTGLEEIARFLMPHLVREGKSTYYEKKNRPPKKFRKNLRRRCRSLANRIYEATGSMGALEETVVETAQPLLKFKWSEADSFFPDQTILESLEDTTHYEGLGLNPRSIGIPEITTNQIYIDGVTRVPRTPGFMEKANASTRRWVYGQGSADTSPVIYNLGSVAALGQSSEEPATVNFCRNAIPSKVYGSAGSVLSVAAAVLTVDRKNGSWTALRLFPQGLPPVEAALDEALKWVKAIAAGLKGIADLIISYIEFLQARILEFQALILRINGLLDALSGFALPAMSGLVVTGNGTDGILQGLVTAENKPSDNSQTFTVDTPQEERIFGTYGGGVVLLAGGLPAILIEILQALFPEKN